jgi:hypothetical protein
MTQDDHSGITTLPGYLTAPHSRRAGSFHTLGYFFTGGRAWREGRMVPAWLNLRDKGQRALHAFIDKCHSVHLHTPYVISKLYDTLVSPVGGYGYEI